jgi:hypothetical protein
MVFTPDRSPKLAEPVRLDARFQSVTLGKVNRLIVILRRIWGDFPCVKGIKEQRLDDDKYPQNGSIKLMIL